MKPQSGKAFLPSTSEASSCPPPEEPSPKNIALANIVENKIATAQVNRCTRVKLLLVGREITKNLLIDL